MTTALGSTSVPPSVMKNVFFERPPGMGITSVAAICGDCGNARRRYAVTVAMVGDGPAAVLACSARTLLAVAGATDRLHAES